MSQYGPLAIAWGAADGRRRPDPGGVAHQPDSGRRRGDPAAWPQSRLPVEGRAVPAPATTGPGEYHQANLVGPRHLDGGISFHAFNLIDVGSHGPGSEILDILRPTSIAAGLVTIWSRVGIPKVV